MTNSIREELLPTSSEKIVSAFIKEFLMNNPLGVPYRITEIDIKNAIEDLKILTEKLPKDLKILEFS